MAVNNPGSRVDGQLEIKDRVWGVGVNLGLLYQVNPGLMRLRLTYNLQVDLDFSAIRN